MIKKWLVKCKVNMDAGTNVKVIVGANTKRKAEIKALKDCHNKGYFSAEVISCREMTETPTKIEHNSLCETETYEVKE